LADVTDRASAVNGAAFVFAIFGIPTVIYFLQAKPKCWTLAESEIETVIRDGKRVASLNLLRIPRGECVTIKP